MINTQAHSSPEEDNSHHTLQGPASVTDAGGSTAGFSILFSGQFVLSALGKALLRALRVSENRTDVVSPLQ